MVLCTILCVCLCGFFFNDTATTEIYTYGHTLSLHDALPISPALPDAGARRRTRPFHPTLGARAFCRSEEHTSELQSLMRISYAVFCLKKKNHKKQQYECKLQHQTNYK